MKHKYTKLGGLAGIALAGLLSPTNVSAQNDSALERLQKHQEKQRLEQQAIINNEENEYFGSLSTGVESGGNPYIEVALNWSSKWDGIKWAFYTRANFEDNVDKKTSAEVTQREKELIGPGTYKTRIDEIRSVEEKSYNPLEIGFGVDYGFGNNAHLFGNLGAIERITKEQMTGESTISYERNGEEVESATISGRESANTSKEIVPVFSAGLQYPLGNLHYLGPSDQDTYAELSLRKIQGEEAKLNAGIGLRF